VRRLDVVADLGADGDHEGVDDVAHQDHDAAAQLGQGGDLPLFDGSHVVCLLSPRDGEELVPGEGVADAGHEAGVAAAGGVGFGGADEPGWLAAGGGGVVEVGLGGHADRDAELAGLGAEVAGGLGEGAGAPRLGGVPPVRVGLRDLVAVGGRVVSDAVEGRVAGGEQVEGAVAVAAGVPGDLPVGGGGVAGGVLGRVVVGGVEVLEAGGDVDDDRQHPAAAGRVVVRPVRVGVVEQVVAHLGE